MTVITNPQKRIELKLTLVPRNNKSDLSTFQRNNKKKGQPLSRKSVRRNNSVQWWLCTNDKPRPRSVGNNSVQRNT